MRLESIRVQNFGPFKDYSVDLTTLPGPLVAVVGPNGAGKSTLLELGLPGALYRSTPTRGSLADLATTRNAALEVRAVNGKPWTFRHLVDAVSKKAEAVVLDAEGRSVLPDTKVRSFDDWASTHLPPPEVLYSCMFAPQGAGGFLSAKPGERKGILLRILGVERLEAQAEFARERAREAKSKLEVLVARLADERARCPDVDVAMAPAIAAQAVEQAEAELAAARRALAEVEEQGRAVTEARRAASDRSALRARLYSERGAAVGRASDLETRIKNNRAVLEDGPAIRAAAAEFERLSPELEAARAGAASAESDARRHHDAAHELGRRAEALSARLDRAMRTLAGREEVAAAELMLPALEKADADARAAYERASSELEALREQRVAGADERIGDLRAALAQVAGTGDETPVDELRDLASAAIDADDAAVDLAAELPEKLKLALEAKGGANARAAAAAAELSKARTVAARAEAMLAAEQDHAAASRERAELLLQRDRELAAEQAALKALAGHRERAQAIAPKLEAAKKLAAKAEPLAHAEARLAELDPQLRAAQAEAERLAAELDASPELETPPAVDTREAEAAVVSADQAFRRATAEAAATAQRAQDARAAKARADELEAERALVEAELADWNKLAKDLGKDGLQAAEIDAAGPELTELTNDLLRSCFGPRFSVRIETQRASADGKRLLEGCEAMVIDSVRGREAPGETFSGGERVIIGEAISLALSMLACRRAGLTGITLCRDETGAALDPESGRAWIAMLRRAAQIVKADKVLFVAHNPELCALADSQISLEGVAA